MSLAIFTYAPREFSTSLRFIVPLFSTFPVPKLTPPVTEPSAIKANAADWSALSEPEVFFWRFIVAFVSLIIAALKVPDVAAAAANFIP